MEKKIDEEHYQIGWQILDRQEDFKHILLPDNTYSKETRGYFEVGKEGTYTFLAYDRAGNETKGSIILREKSK